MMYPEITRQASTPESTKESIATSMGHDWVTIESGEDMYEVSQSDCNVHTSLGSHHNKHLQYMSFISLINGFPIILFTRNFMSQSLPLAMLLELVSKLLNCMPLVLVSNNVKHHPVYLLILWWHLVCSCACLVMLRYFCERKNRRDVYSAWYLV